MRSQVYCKWAIFFEVRAKTWPQNCNRPQNSAKFRKISAKFQTPDNGKIPLPRASLKHAPSQNRVKQLLDPENYVPQFAFAARTGAAALSRAELTASAPVRRSGTADGWEAGPTEGNSEREQERRGKGRDMFVCLQRQSRRPQQKVPLVRQAVAIESICSGLTNTGCQREESRALK